MTGPAVVLVWSAPMDRLFRDHVSSRRRSAVWRCSRSAASWASSAACSASRRSESCAQARRLKPAALLL